MSRSRHARRPPWAFALPLLPRRPHHHGLGVTSRRQTQDDPRDEPHAVEQPQCPGDDHHEWCRCAVCSWWPDCYCGLPGCDGHRSDADLVQEVTRRTPDLRVPLAPLLRAA